MNPHPIVNVGPCPWDIKLAQYIYSKYKKTNLSIFNKIFITLLKRYIDYDKKFLDGTKITSCTLYKELIKMKKVNYVNLIYMFSIELKNLITRINISSNQYTNVFENSFDYIIYNEANSNINELHLIIKELLEEETCWKDFFNNTLLV
jgi:hypothetical protein